MKTVLTDEEVNTKLAEVPAELSVRVNREWVEMFESMFGPLTTENVTDHFSRVDGNAWRGSVQLYSARSGQLLRWISYSEFRDVYILKTKPEYPAR